MIRYAKIVSIILFACMLTVLAGEDNVFPGKWGIPTSNIPEVDFEWKPIRNPFESQSLYLLERMENGGWVIIYFFVLKAPIGEKWGVIATVTEPDGKRYQFKEEVPGNEIGFKPGSAQIKMGQCSFDGKAPTYRVHFEAGGLAADLVFSNLVPTWKPGDGTTYYSPDKKTFYKYSAVCPFSKVAGSLKYNNKTVNAAGWGFGDRAQSNLSFFHQNRMIYAVRAFPKKTDGPKYAVSMLEYIAHSSYNSMRLPTLIIMDEKGYLVSTRNYTLKTADFRKDTNTGYSYPWRIDITGQDQGVDFKLHSQATRVEDVLDVINELPSYLRPIARKYFARPVFYRFTGGLTGELTLKDGSKARIDLDGYSEVTFIQKD